MDFNLTEEQKKAALEAGKQGMKNAYEKSGTRPGLTWWERLLWVVLAGAAYAASSLLSGCGHTDMQGRFLPGAGTGAFVLLPETAENGDASGYPENPAG